MTPAEAGLLAAISDYLSPSWDQRDTYGEAAYHHAAAEVQRAIAVLTAEGWDQGAVRRFTALLGGKTELPPEHAGEVVPQHTDDTGHVLAAFCPGDCITCHGHVDAKGVFTPARAAS